MWKKTTQTSKILNSISWNYHFHCLHVINCLTIIFLVTCKLRNKRIKLKLVKSLVLLRNIDNLSLKCQYFIIGNRIHIFRHKASSRVLFNVFVATYNEINFIFSFSTYIKLFPIPTECNWNTIYYSSLNKIIFNKISTHQVEFVCYSESHYLLLSIFLRPISCWSLLSLLNIFSSWFDLLHYPCLWKTVEVPLLPLLKEGIMVCNTCIIIGV